MTELLSREAILRGIESWRDWMLVVSVHAAALGLLVLSLELATRRRLWPELRTALWTLALFRLVLPAQLASPFSLAGALRAPGSLTETDANSPLEAAGGTASLSVVLFALWILGVLGSLVLLTLRDARGRRAACALERSIPADDTRCSLLLELARTLGVSRPPRLVESLASTPYLRGLRRPILALPVESRDWSAASLEHVLLHELAHARRRDPLRRRALELLHVMFWFHPLL